MKNSKEIRTCIGCRNKKHKSELLRLEGLKEGHIIIDINGKMHGRGAYICKNEECLKKASKNKSLNFNEQILNEIRGVILGG